MTETSTPDEPVFDDVAGELHPWPQGPCNAFLVDGRSNICARCDWPEGRH